MSRHRFTLRVPYADVDQMGFVYYANYFKYFEMARTAVLRDAGHPYAELEKRGVLLPVLQADCVYRQPGRYEDVLAVDTTRMTWKGPRLRIEYEVFRVAEGNDRDEALLATGFTTHACMSPEGRPLKPDPVLRAIACGG